MARSTGDSKTLDRTVARARREAERRAGSYREQALRLFPWVCGRCGREFTRANVRELTVHHRNHDHDDNPPDGSNWELLCLYCHDNEHARLTDHDHGELASGQPTAGEATSRPFEGLGDLLKQKGKGRQR